jgi:hypothetical protein
MGIFDYGWPRRSSLNSSDGLAWTVAGMTFGLGDILTTAYFLSIDLNHESHPIVASAIGELGLWILPIWKGAALLLFVVLHRFTPTSVRIGIPTGLSLLGSALVVWNTYSSLTGARIVL